MPILSSRLAEDSRQIDGRRWVREQHTDHVGIVHEVVYMAEVGQAVDLVTSAARIEAQLVETEIAANETEILGADL
jgi:hypothetical protein